MTLNTPSYLVYLLGAAALHAALPAGFRNLFLLGASALFCGLNGAEMLAVPALVAAVSYFGAKRLAGEQAAPRKKRLLVFLVVLVLLPLLLFKYADLWGAVLQSPVKLLLPLGISFYTFEALGYLIDVYHGKLAPENSFLLWLLAMFFFPQFSSGPIARMRDLLPQLRNAEREVTPALAGEGLRRILLGAAAKVVLADGLGILISAFYGDPSRYGGAMELVGMLLYPLQIYFDFSGYSGMAIGSALLFGVRLSENFTAPFLAVSLSETWKRWHMSLTGWFQDYVFTPLVWSRWADRVLHPHNWQSRRPHLLLNLVLVFLLSAVWHGAAPGYLVWGALMAAGRVLEETVPLLSRRRKTLLARLLGRAGVYLWWTLSLLFFRLPSWQQLHLFLWHLAAPLKQSPLHAVLFAASQGITSTDTLSTGSYYLLFFGSMAICFAVLLYCDIQTDRSLRRRGAAVQTDPIRQLPTAARWAVYWAVGFAVAALYLVTATGDVPSFIYAGY